MTQHDVEPAWVGTVRGLIATAERSSLEICDRCGAQGKLHAVMGFYATRCGKHAEPGSAAVPKPDSDRDDTDPVSDRDRTNATTSVESGDTADPAPGLSNVGWPRLRDRFIPLDEPPETSDPEPSQDDPSRMALYSLADVSAAAGLNREPDAFLGDQDERSSSTRGDTDHQARLGRILDAGERGRWRDLAMVGDGVLEALDALSRRAPHLDAVTDLVRRHLRASRTLGLPVALPPLLLLGPPGVGKSWYLTRLAAALGLPFRSYPMNIATLGDGISGGHPTWRNAAPGLVARTLLRERVANPLILVDEFDKGQSHNNHDPYTAFYSLLDRTNAAGFVDEYLQFPIDASHVLWVLAGNDASLIPEPILDRLTVLTVPDMSPVQRVAVCRSIYAEANAARRGFFEPELAQNVIERLVDANPRSIRVMVEDAMTSAAAEGRARLSPDDIGVRGTPARQRIGFR